MTIQDPATGLTVDVEVDGDGFPVVRIDTNGDCYDEKFRPTVLVELNGVVVHAMFDHDGTDNRWTE